jgi:hypothetical protein
MSRKRKTMRNRVLDLSVDDVEEIIKLLAKQMNATKTMYFRHRGVITDSRTVPDHATQLRALHELAKLHGLYPTRGSSENRSSDDSERSDVRLVIKILDAPLPDNEVGLSNLAKRSGSFGSS